MNFHEYQQACLRTESPVTHTVKHRFTLVGSLVLKALEAPDPDLADRVKKYVFYGKPLEGYYIDDGRYESLRLGKLLLNFPRGQESFIRLSHALLGILSEFGEMTGAVLDGLIPTGQDFETNIAEELGGDAPWYCALGLDAVGKDFQQTAEANVQKLLARYGDRFTETAAQHRDLSAENRALSGS